MIKKVVLANDVTDELRALPRPVLLRGISAVKELRQLLVDSAYRRSITATQHFDTRLVSISFYVKNGQTLCIVGVTVQDAESSNVIWMVSRKKYEEEAASEAAFRINKRRASSKN